MLRALKNSKLNYLLIIIYAIFLFILLKSVITFGINYLYDIDELGHSQYVYLFINKVKPYLTFDLTVTPLYHWTLIPVFKLFGFSFATIHKARILMIILFLLRILITFLLVRATFGLKVAIIFSGIFLLDPFTTFSSIQIRPDNLMIIVFTIGLLILHSALKSQKNYLYLISGTLFSLSTLILLKMAPSVTVIFFLIAVYCIIKKRFAILFYFSTGLAIPVILFLLYALSQNYLSDMIQQIIFDRALYNKTLLNKGSVWFYYRPNNFYLYGFQGKPLSWFFTIILPFTSILGSILLTYKITKSKKINPDSLFKIILVFLFFSQILWLLTVQGIFLQYFLTLSYLFAIFTAYLLSKLNRFLLLTVFIFIALNGSKGNYNKATYTNAETIKNFQNIWKIIPENEASFPNTLFRPIAYPLTFGTYLGDAPKKVFSRWPPLTDYLEQKQINYLILSDYDFMFIDPKTAIFIRDKYQIIAPDTNIWKRK